MKRFTVVIEYADNQPIPCPSDMAPVLGGYIVAWVDGDALTEDVPAAPPVTCPKCGREYEAAGCFECPKCMHEWDEMDPIAFAKELEWRESR